MVSSFLFFIGMISESLGSDHVKDVSENRFAGGAADQEPINSLELD